MTIIEFQKIILSWYAENKRDLPWRNTYDPYQILVSEVMLQQTQIVRVLPKYHEFLRVFPSLEALSRTSNQKLFRVWTGLGYWRRALYLKQTAQKICKEYKGIFPQNPQALQEFPGIGPYTAGALACFAFQNTDAFLDTNIRRVYLHFFFPDKKNIPDTEILKIAQKAVWKKNPREWHYALFDYGAIVLKNKTLNKQSRHYHRQTPFEGSFRSFRTQAVRYLLAQPQGKAHEELLTLFLQKELKKKKSPYHVGDIIGALLKDKLIKKKDCFYLV